VIDFFLNNGKSTAIITKMSKCHEVFFDSKFI
jgi:hypothetical protein